MKVHQYSMLLRPRASARRGAARRACGLGDDATKFHGANRYPLNARDLFVTPPSNAAGLKCHFAARFVLCISVGGRPQG